MITLNNLIDQLEDIPTGSLFPEGFCEPHSYRGYYDQLAVEPCGIKSREDLLGTLYDALDSTYEGWKGGEFVMDGDVSVYLSYEGSASNEVIIGFQKVQGADSWELLTEEEE